MIYFSIIAISYNQPQHVEALFQSLLLMDFNVNDYEVILVDDGSDSPISGSIKIPDDINIRTVYLPRSVDSCRARARNSGANLAKGEYLVFIDGDCLVGMNFLTNYKKFFSDHSNINVALGSFCGIDFNKKPGAITGEFLQSLEAADPYSREDLRFYLEKFNKAKIWEIHASWLLLISRNFAIKASVFKWQGGFDERFKGWGSEDTEFAYRLCKAGVKYELLPNKVFHLSEIIDYKNFENKYKTWVENVGLFYSIHRDPVILLLMTQEKLIFDSLVLGKGWDHEFQIKSFLALKQKIAILERMD